MLPQFEGFSRNARLLLATAFCAGLSMALGALFLNFYLQSLGLDQQFIGLINAVPFVILVVIGLPVGRLIDRFGPRWGLLVGIAGAALGSLGFALTGMPAALLAFAALQGVGQAFGFISIAPFQMASSTERERVALFSVSAALVTSTSFLGNLVGGRLPALFGRWLDAAPEGVLPLRATMLVVAAVWALATLPMLLAEPDRVRRSAPQPLEEPGQAGLGAAPARRRRRLLSRPDVVWRLLLPAFLIGLGAGQTMPFLNIFISTKFGVDFGSLGIFFALGALGTTMATLAQPILAARVGRVQSVVMVQIASLPFLIMLGFAPVFWLVAISFVVRNALMNMGNPVYQAFAQEQIPPGEQATYSSVSSIIWSLGWALGSAFSGWWRGRVGFVAGFNTVFAAMTIFYLISITLIHFFFVRGARRPGPEPGHERADRIEGEPS